MSNGRAQIKETIVKVLGTVSKPLKAREISIHLRNRGMPVNRTTINSILYTELSRSKTVVQDSEYRWSLTRTPRATEQRSAAPEELVVDVELTEGLQAVSAPEERRAARRVLHTLRGGTTSCGAAKAISVGTSDIQQELFLRIDSLHEHDTKDEAVVVAADWGFGKSHIRMLLSSHLAEIRLPFVHECIDARAASLAHIHRSVPRWLERIQFGRTIGLRDAFHNGTLSTEQAAEWAKNDQSDFAYGLHHALAGSESGWLRALGHYYRTPDYPYQHPKAWALIESAATLLKSVHAGGVVLLLDEVENIDKQYDIRGRRKSYDTLARMMRHPSILPVLFVTDRLCYQVEQDRKQGASDGWWNWTLEAKWFVNHFQDVEPLRPPRLTDRLAEQLVSSIATLYRSAYPSSAQLSPDRILIHWRRMATRSTRLLVRLTINELDLLAQNSSGQEA